MLDYLFAVLGTMTAKLGLDEEGQTAVEYALVLLLVALVLVGALALGLGGALDDAIAKIKAKL